jgi:hypothetical protein
MASIDFATSSYLPPTFDLRGVVSRAISSARAAGFDYMGQSRAAAAAVSAVRPDLSPRQALDAVTRVRDFA